MTAYRTKSASMKFGENSVSLADDIREKFILNYKVLACSLFLPKNKYKIREHKMTNVTYEAGCEQRAE